MTVSVFATDTRLVKLASCSVSLPAPRSTVPFTSAVPSVTVSVPVPPITCLHIVDGAGVAAVGEGQLVGARRRDRPTSRWSSALPRVMVSLPVPPVMVSVLATVAVLVKLPKVRMSLPAPRSMERIGGGGAERDGVGAGAADQRVDVLDGAGVGGVRQVSACWRRRRGRPTCALVSAVPRVTVSVAGAADDGLDVGDGGRCW